YNMLLLLASYIISIILFPTTVLAGVHISQPNASTVWIQGSTYQITWIEDRSLPAAPPEGYTVNLLVLGAECEEVCIPDGVVANIANNVQGTDSPINFTVPTLGHFGKVILKYTE